MWDPDDTPVIKWSNRQVVAVVHNALKNKVVRVVWRRFIFFAHVQGERRVSFLYQYLYWMTTSVECAMTT